MRTEFLCISVLRVASGPKVKLASCKSVLNPPVVYSTDRSKAVVLMLVLLFVALWLILLGDLFYVLPCASLFLCFSVLLALRLPLPLGVWEGLRFVIVALPGLFSYRCLSIFLIWICLRRNIPYYILNRWHLVGAQTLLSLSKEVLHRLRSSTQIVFVKMSWWCGRPSVSSLFLFLFCF